MGRLDRVDAMQLELLEQTILERAPQAFDTSLGLGGTGGDIADAQFFQHLAELGWQSPSLQLLVEAPAMVIADGDAGAIAVEDLGQPVAAQDVPQDDGEAVQILLRPERQRQHLAGGVVDRPHQGQQSLSLPQPGVLTAIDQHHAALTGAPFPPVMVTRRPPAMDRPEPQRAPDPPDAVVTDRQVLQRQQVDDMTVVQPHLRMLEQRLDPLSDRWVQPASRGSTSVAMHQRLRSLAPHSLLESLHMPDAESQCLSHSAVARLAARCGFQQAQPPGCTNSHECVVHGGDILTAELGDDIFTAEQQERDDGCR